MHTASTGGVPTSSQAAVALKQQALVQAVIGAKVFKTDRRFVFLDTGFNKYVKYAKKELHLSQLVSSKDGGLRTSPEDFRVGDVLQFVVEELETPYGDMQLAVERRIENDKVAGVWEMVKEAMRSNQPVMGRVLNGVNGGYSVGVAGIVAFCPFSQMSFLTASKVGMLQPFLVTSMNEAKRNIVLQDVSMLGKRRGPRGDLVSDQGRSPYRAAH
ncbi:g2881 [Coccomyxa elongata]